MSARELSTVAVCVAVGIATVGCGESSLDGSGASDASANDAGAEQNHDAVQDSASVDASSEQPASDSSTPDASPECEAAVCVETVYRQFDVVRLVVEQYRIVTRTGFQGSFPEGPGGYGVFEYVFGASESKSLADPPPGVGWGFTTTGSWLYGCSKVAEPGLWRLSSNGGMPTYLTTSACNDVTASLKGVFVTAPVEKQVQKVDTSNGTLTPVAQTSGEPEVLARDQTWLYWSVSGGSLGGAIERMPIDGGTAETLASNVSVSVRAGLELDETHVYWVSGQARRVPKAGGVVEMLASSPVCADIAIDGDHIYCTAGAELVRFAKSGAGSAEVIASGFTSPLELVAIADSYVYFTMDGAYHGQYQEADQVLRVAKPAL